MLSLLIVLLLQPLLINSESDITTPINSFGLELLKHVPADKNVMISPFSICTAVAMLNAGASGETKQQIDSAFGWPGSTDISTQYKDLLTKMDESEENKFDLSSNNRLYIDSTFTPLQSYSTELDTNFNADVEAVNFSKDDNSNTVKLINTWVEEKTNGKIKDMFSSISNSVRAILINTIYFKASWTYPFSSVSEEEFYLDEKYIVQTDTMHIEERLPYFSDNDVELVKLPYDRGRISMVVIKPKGHAGLSNLRKIIKYKFSEVALWMKNVEHKQLKLSMPKFKFESGVRDLKEVLMKDFGVSDVFNNEGKADLSGISTTEDLFVSFIIHKSFISVDENGTEAAAATAIGIMLTSMMERDEPQEVLINQPFLFLIYDEVNKVVLFAGRMVVPDESKLSYKYLDSKYVDSGAVSGIVQYSVLMWIVMVMTCFIF